MRQAITFSPVESSFDRDEKRSNEEFDMFWKELIPVGTWKHPIKGFTLKVDKGRLDLWASNFAKQKGADIRVPVPYGHRYDASSNAGFVEEVEVREKQPGKFSLFGLLNIPRNEDSDRINKTIKDVSVSVNPNLKHSTAEGKVEEFGECIEHTALTNYPVIAGMQDFVAFDQEGETVAIVHLDMTSDEVSESAPEGFALNQNQLKEFARDVAQNTLAALTVNRDLESQQLLEGEKEMAMTPEQLRVLEKKFDLKEDSLTEENWFDIINGLDLDKESEEKDPPKEFDITENVEFQKLQKQNHALLLDCNKRRLGDISRRLSDAFEKGQINKAAYDKIISDEKQLQFSQETCIGSDWEGWAHTLEAQLDIVEQLPEGHVVPVGQSTSDRTSNFLSQFEADEEGDESAEDLEKLADEAVKSATPHLHKGNVQMDPKSGTFMSVAGK